MIISFCFFATNKWKQINKNGGDKEMFIGSFHRVVNREDNDSKIPWGSSDGIVYVENEKKFDATLNGS